MSINILSLLKVIQNAVMVAVATLAMTLFAPAVSAQASDFNHMKTGFPLTGVHINVECETCHVGGIFKGTPKDCAGCHSAGRRVVAPAKHASHIITNAPCESCHTNSITFLGARFDHMGVQPRACMTCHNGGMAPGKPARHVATSSQCDTCHRSSTWIPASYNHVGVTSGTCATCHNGSTAPGKPTNHIPTTITDPLNCDTCHLSFTSWSSERMNHNGIQGLTGILCTTCHLQGVTYIGRMEKKSLTHEASGHTDCSDSGCHRPRGNEGTSYINWD